MSKGTSFENELLLLLFNNSDMLLIGDAGGITGSGGAGSFWIRLYTDAVTTDDDTLGTEAAYTGYSTGGQAVARTAGGWTIAADNASNTAAITFDPCTGGSETIKFFAIFRSAAIHTEADRLYWGQLTSDLAVSNGITPEFAIGALDVNED